MQLARDAGSLPVQYTARAQPACGRASTAVRSQCHAPLLPGLATPAPAHPSVVADDMPFPWVDQEFEEYFFE